MPLARRTLLKGLGAALLGATARIYPLACLVTETVWEQAWRHTITRMVWTEKEITLNAEPARWSQILDPHDWGAEPLPATTRDMRAYTLEPA